jgi:uncharacterized membrane protein YcaP (DUF421 family)
MHETSGSLIAIACRTAFVLIYLVLGLRLFGKRQLGQMNIYDLTMIMLLANAVQNSLAEAKGSIMVGVVSATTLVLLGRALTQMFLRSRRFQERLVGSPTVLIHNGHVQDDHMRRECITREDLLAALRSHGLTDPRDAKLAVLEVDGSLSVVPKRKRSG